MATPSWSTCQLSPIVLLVGSTGSGKSSLGNFLLNPAHKHITIQKTFPISRSNVPETNQVKCASDNLANPTIQVIDTPGLNEGDYEDLMHMREIVRTLRGLHYVSACILCMKFNAKIDHQWKATVAYYRKLLEQLFESNVLIVMTEFLTDSRSVQQREIQGIDVDEVTGNVVSAVIECAHLTYPPPVFRIDSLPLDSLDRSQSERDRDAILGYIRASLNPVRVSELKLAKTDALKQKDKEDMGRLYGEINGYKDHLIMLKSKAETVLNKIQWAENLVTEVECRLISQKRELRAKDSTETVTAETWSLKEKWKWFRWQSLNFECESNWRIVSRATWDNGHLKWKVLNLEEYRVSGMVEGEFMRGLYATLILKTEKREIYAERIRELRDTIRSNEELLEGIRSQLGEIRKEGKEQYEKEIDALIKFIENKKKEKEMLLQEHISLDGAELRLKQLLCTQT